MKKKKLVNKKSKAKKESFAIFTISFVFVAMIILGICASRILRGTFSAKSYSIQFMGAEGYNLSDNSHYASIAPPNGICETDEYGYIDPECAYKIACICREWSQTKAGTLYNDDGSVSCAFPCQGVALTSSDLFTLKFNSGATYYCHGGSSYASACDVEKPTNACYECTSNGEKKYTKTINATRAAAYTGGNNCKVVSNSECEPKPVTSCYSCKLGSGNEYAYATSTAEASTKTGGNNCQAVDNSKCDNPPSSCYSCKKGNESHYIKTTTKSNAESTYTGSTCTIVADSECNPKPVTSCYSCKLGSGNEYTYATSETEAGTKTGGNSCQAVADAFCTTNHNNCYSCLVGDRTKYTYASSTTAAETTLGGRNCSIVNENYCKPEPKENPKTGTISTILVLIAGLSSLGLIFKYIYKIK